MAQVKFLKGTYAGYQAITAKDASTLYFVTDKGVMFLGDKRFSDVVLATAEPLQANMDDNRIYIYNGCLYFKGATEAVKLDAASIASEIAALKAAVGEGGNVDARISAAIAALDKDDAPIEGQYVAGVSEADGIITVTRKPLPDYTDTYDAKGAADAVKEAVVGTAADLSTADTIKGAKKHADEAVAAEKSRAEAAEAQALDDAKAYADAEDKKIEDSIGTVTPGKTVVQMIEEAKTAATYDDTALKGRVTANEEAITKLNGASTVEGSVDYKIAQAVAKIMENPDETMNSINELVTWCNSHATEALALTNKVNANEVDIAALEGLVGSTAVATQITDAIAAALKIDGVDKYALATDLTAAIGRIAALEKDTHTHANKTELDKIATGDKAKWDAMEKNAKDYADGLATNYDAAGSAAQALTDAKSYTDTALTWGTF